MDTRKKVRDLLNLQTTHGTNTRVNTHRVCSKVIRKMRNTRANLALNNWRASARQAIKRAALLKKVVARWTHQLTCAFFHLWAEKAQKAARMERVCSRMLLKMLNQRLSVALLTWREHSKEHIRISLLCARIMSKLLNSKSAMQGVFRGGFLAVEIIVPLWFRQAAAETVLVWSVGTM